ncbi:TetR/AcrR family transcriptional regulator [Nibrella viscosa]|uniref:TetR/AcrR family transcriptional regulator n=1 Tax=Nibrella viscosa TaxID=1084524 RepID=A0ABP8KKF6_9BACT
MTTRDTILNLADHLIKDKGFNAFSFHDLSRTIGIKTASIHYHFPTKTDLVIAVIRQHIDRFAALKESLADKDPITKLRGFFSIYAQLKKENKVCLVGSLATDLHTVDERIQGELKTLAGQILDWVTDILQEGQEQGIFHFDVPVRTKAILIITNMMAIVQLSRLTGDDDFKLVKYTILEELQTTH